MKEKIEAQKAHISPELVAKAKEGDQAAFSELYMQTNKALYRSICSMVHDDETAWDIEQETYLKAFQNLYKLEHNEAFLPWLRRISVNVTATEMSKRLPMNFSELGDEDDEQPDQVDCSIDNQPELALDRKETSRLVQEILAELPEQQHLILGMRYYEDLSVKEISELLHLAPTTVKTQLFRGRKRVETAVRALEQKGVKLYGLSPMAFLIALMRRAEPTEYAVQATGKAVLAKTLSGTAAVAASNVTVSTAGRVLAGKLVAGFLSLALIGGGIWAGGKLLRTNESVAPYQPTNAESVEQLPARENGETEAPIVYVEPSNETTVLPETEAIDPSICGENLSWRYEEDEYGIPQLMIEGSGAMYDYDNEAHPAPWQEYRETVCRIVLPEGISRIGNYAFSGFSELYEVELHNDAVIGQGAFQDCTELTLLVHCRPTAIEADAFRGCTSLIWVQTSDQLREIGDGAFTDCTNLYELWILDGDCKLGKDIAAGSTVAIFGQPGSMAEQYANENGFRFGAIQEDPEAVRSFLKEAGNEESAWIAGIVPVGTEYLAKVVRREDVIASKAELEQAKQNGSITLAGKLYLFSDSKEQGLAWDANGVNYENAVAWIRDEENRVAYIALPEGDGYRFEETTWYEGNGRLQEAKQLGWVRLDGTERAEFNNDENTVASLVASYMAMPWDYTICNLRLDESGAFWIAWESSGKR